MKYIHYGHDKFDKNKFVAIKNFPYMTKPFGGLWASREDSENGWKNFVDDNNLTIGKFDTAFTFSLKETARILTIDHHDILKQLPKVKNDLPINAHITLDFEKISENYDAIEVLISEDRWLYHQLYGWDCDSILIMNPDVVIPFIQKEKSNETKKITEDKYSIAEIEK